MLSQTDKEKAFSVFNLYAEGGLDDLDDLSPFTSLNNRNFTRAVAACGFKVSQQVVNNIFHSLETDSNEQPITEPSLRGTGTVNLRNWMKFYEKQLMKDVKETAIRDNFERILLAAGNEADTSGKSFIDKLKFRRFLTEYGQKMSDEEADAVIRECLPDENDRIYYEGYRSMLIDK